MVELREGRQPAGAADVRRDRPRSDAAQAREVRQPRARRARRPGNSGSSCVQKSPRPFRERRSAKYDLRKEISDTLDTFSPAEAPAAPPLRERADDSGSVQVGSHAHLSRLECLAARLRRARPQDRRVRRVPGHAGAGRRPPAAPRYQLRDEIGQLEYKVWYFASLAYDQDQRDNQLNARRQQVQILFAKDGQAVSWFDPELLKIPLDDRPAVDRSAARSSASIGSRSKISTASRSTCSTTKASTCCRSRAGFRRRRTTPTRRCRRPTSSIRPSGCRRAPTSR